MLKKKKTSLTIICLSLGPINSDNLITTPCPTLQLPQQSKLQMIKLVGDNSPALSLASVKVNPADATPCYVIPM